MRYKMISIESATAYCKEDISRIENYDLAIIDTEEMWHCHHRREITENKSMSQLILERKYYQVPASDLIFLRKGDHISLHNKNRDISSFYNASHTKEIQEKVQQTRRNNGALDRWVKATHTKEVLDKIHKITGISKIKI